MTNRELAGVRSELVEFAAHMFESFRRCEQCKWGEVYLRGLMGDGKRKSIQPMAARLEDGNEQALQQFLSQSSWDWEPVRKQFAKTMNEQIEVDGYVIDDTGFPKYGRHSAGVARQYSGTLGKISSCQVGVSLHLASDLASAPINWRLFLPTEWNDDTERRAKAHLPQDVQHVPKWQLALEMIDEATGWGLPPKPIVCDAGYGDITQFRMGLQDRGLSYVAAVKSNTSCYRINDRSREQGPAGRKSNSLLYEQNPTTLKKLVTREIGRTGFEVIKWREGSNPKTPLESSFLVTRVRPGNRKLREQAKSKGAKELQAVWLICQWSPDSDEPSHYWLSNLHADTPPEQLIRLAKLRWRVEHDYRELKDGLGLDHFEGRSYAGWHHHTTLVSVAHGFLTLQRLKQKKEETRQTTTNTLLTPQRPSTANSMLARYLPYLQPTPTNHHPIPNTNLTKYY